MPFSMVARLGDWERSASHTAQRAGYAVYECVLFELIQMSTEVSGRSNNDRTQTHTHRRTRHRLRTLQIAPATQRSEPPTTAPYLQGICTGDSKRNYCCTKTREPEEPSRTSQDSLNEHRTRTVEADRGDGTTPAGALRMSGATSPLRSLVVENHTSRRLHTERER